MSQCFVNKYCDEVETKTKNKFIFDVTRQDEGEFHRDKWIEIEWELSNVDIS